MDKEQHNVSFLFFCLLFFWFLCAQLELNLRRKSLKEPEGEDQGASGNPKKEDFLRLISLKYLQNSPPRSKDEYKDFLSYLTAVMDLRIKEIMEGSVIITVICTSLEILEVLWKDCNTGHMDKVAQKLLITNDVIKEFGNVKITVTILEEEYKACRAYFLQLSGKP